MTLGDRIRLVRNGMSQKDFCDKFKIAINTLRRYEKGENPPDAEFLVALCKEYDLNPTWLLTDEGAMRYNEGDNSHHKYDEKTCDCMSTSRMDLRADLFSSKATTVNFDLMQHVINEIANFKIAHPEGLPEEELREVSMVSYSFCQTTNQMAADLICSIVKKWRNKK